MCECKLKKFKLVSRHGRSLCRSSGVFLNGVEASLAIALRLDQHDASAAVSVTSLKPDAGAMVG